MAKLFQANDYTNGAFSIVNHPIKGLATKTAKPGSMFGTMDAGDADLAVSKSIELAGAHGVSLDRWSFYIAGVSEKLDKADKHLPVKALKKAVKDGFVATVEMGKFSHPRITLRDPQAVVARTSTVVVLA
jgi:hypothetical protein